MSPEMLTALWGAALLWAIAIVVKAARALRAHQPYVFAFWDGGMLRMGRGLDRKRTIIKLAVVAPIGVAAAIYLTVSRGSVPVQISWVALTCALVSVVSDFTAPDATRTQTVDVPPAQQR